MIIVLSVAFCSLCIVVNVKALWQITELIEMNRKYIERVEKLVLELKGWDSE